jgi:hypothetical protein
VLARDRIQHVERRFVFLSHRIPSLAPLTDSSTLVAKGGAALWSASLGSRALSSDRKVRSGNGSFPLPLSFVVSADCMPSDGR